MQFFTDSRADYKRIKTLILQFLKEQIRNSRGNLVSFRPAKVAYEIAQYTRRSPRAETVIVRNYLDKLVELGYIEVIKKSSRGKLYGIYKTSKLWQLLETNNEVNSIYLMLENELLMINEKLIQR